MNRNLILLLTAYLAFVVFGIAMSLVNIAWSAEPDNSIQSTFQVTNDLLGVLLIANTIGGLVSSFFAGWLIARFGIARFVFIGLILATIGVLGYALSPTWALLLVLVLIGGLGTGAMDAGFNTFVSANYSAGRVNWLHAAFGIGTTVGPIFVTLLVVNGGQAWQLSYLLVAVPLFLIALLVLFNARHWTLGDRTATTDTPQQKSASARETLGIPIVLIGLPMFFLYGGVEFGTGQLAYNVLIGRGISADVAGTWVSLYWGSFTVGRLLMGVIADLLPPRRLLRLTMIGMLIGVGLFWANLGDLPSLIGLLLVGFSVAPMFPIFIAQTPARIGQRHAPNAIGFQISATMVGIALVPGLGGVLIERVGVEAIPMLLAICAIGVALLYEVMIARESRQVALTPAGD